MRLAISNIAWDPAEDELVARLLTRYRVDAIDVAPGKYFPRPAEASDSDILRVREWWRSRGIAITGMQSLLFGTSGLNVFGGAESQERMLQHLSAVCRIAAGLGGPRLVFGSPKNRDRTGLTDVQAEEVAASFFSRLGNIAQDAGVVICLEPNPAAYGCNFMLHTAEAARMVRRVAHPAIRLQLDSGAVAMNGEDPAQTVAQFRDDFGHIHASEPSLVPLGDGDAPHARIAAALREVLPDALVSIEMVATTTEPHVTSIERALMTAIHHYRPERASLGQLV